MVFLTINTKQANNFIHGYTNFYHCVLQSYTVPTNQQNFVYCIAIKYGSLEDWDFLWKKFEESDSAVHRMTILSGLACSQNSTNLRR